jgi:uncharacterized SAM-binding protein YcdF (DUF218 family)
MFLFKKITRLFMSPLTVSMLMLVVGTFMLLFTRKQKTGKFMTASGVVFILLMGYNIFPDRILSTLENKYPPIIETESVSDAKWIVVLGGGHVTDRKVPVASILAGDTLTRVVEGVIIHKRLPESRLLFSGGKAFDPESESKTMADLAVELGVNKSKITEEPNGLDTGEQSELVKKIVGKDKFILVTSAYHMPRAIALFRKQGMNPVPAPVGHRIKEKSTIDPYMFFPRSGGIEKMEIVVHEYLGLCWMSVSGWIL